MFSKEFLLMQKTVIIVAGGNGNRMRSDIPKQFLEIDNKPILMHTIEKFYQFDNLINIILVLPENHIKYWHAIVNKYNFPIHVSLIKGGETRFHSVKNGLALVEDGIVGIHDAVRPFVSFETIKAAYLLAELKGNAIPVISVNDSIRIINKETNNHIERDLVKIVQTPQCFDVKCIKNAYQQDFDPTFTDDASVLEKYGNEIFLSEGNSENIKITTPIDLKIANILKNL